jgi:hypothetical protein
MPKKPKAFKPFRHDTPQHGAMDAGSTQRRQVYSSHRWTIYSRKFKQRFPFCLDPFDEHRHRLQDVDQPHHLVKLKESTAHAFDEAMIIPVCRSCHERIENLTVTLNRVEQWKNDKTFRMTYWKASTTNA